MRKSEKKLVAIRRIQDHSPRRLCTRGASPRDLDSVAPRQSMRSHSEKWGPSHMTKISVAKRWLRQQAGRRWNDVYSELRQQYRAQPNVADLALERVLTQVERNVFIAEDGRVMAWDAYSVCEVTHGLYVHPVTGILGYLDGFANAAKFRKLRQQQREQAGSRNRIQVTVNLQLRKLNELWFWVELAPIVEPKRKWHPERVFKDGSRFAGWSELLYDTICVDVLTHKEFKTVPTTYWDTRELVREYGQPTVYAKRKWQASREDVRRHVAQEPLAA